MLYCVLIIMIEPEIFLAQIIPAVILCVPLYILTNDLVWSMTMSLFVCTIYLNIGLVFSILKWQFFTAQINRIIDDLYQRFLLIDGGSDTNQTEFWFRFDLNMQNRLSENIPIYEYIFLKKEKFSAVENLDDFKKLYAPVVGDFKTSGYKRKISLWITCWPYIILVSALLHIFCHIRKFGNGQFSINSIFNEKK